MPVYTLLRHSDTEVLVDGIVVNHRVFHELTVAQVALLLKEYPGQVAVRRRDATNIVLRPCLDKNGELAGLYTDGEVWHIPPEAKERPFVKGKFDQSFTGKHRKTPPDKILINKAIAQFASAFSNARFIYLESTLGRTTRYCVRHGVTPVPVNVDDLHDSRSYKGTLENVLAVQDRPFSIWIDSTLGFKKMRHLISMALATKLVAGLFAVTLSCRRVTLAQRKDDKHIEAVLDFVREDALIYGYPELELVHTPICKRNMITVMFRVAPVHREIGVGDAVIVDNKEYEGHVWLVESIEGGQAALTETRTQETCLAPLRKLRISGDMAEIRSL